MVQLVLNAVQFQNPISHLLQVFSLNIRFVEFQGNFREFQLRPLWPLLKRCLVWSYIPVGDYFWVRFEEGPRVIRCFRGSRNLVRIHIPINEAPNVSVSVNAAV